MARPARTLALTTDQATYDHGQTGEVLVELATDSSRTTQVYAAEAGRARTLIFSGDVPRDGLRLQYTMRRNTIFSAEIAEDGRALDAYASVDRKTRAGLKDEPKGAYDVAGEYHLFRPAT